ncbi:MAG: hypothetical protein O3A14_04765 [Cyanobacteria bacterium]|nr:hypothetical protein [Cyanobacteriota bacterium]
MNSTDLARYIEATEGTSKPWLLVLLQLQQLKEQRATLAPEDYLQQVQELHETLMAMGEWWVGIEDEVFRDLPG